MAIYFCRPYPTVAHRLIIEGSTTYTLYNDYGREWIQECEDDIVSRWEDPIDEEKLDDMAECWNTNTVLHPTIYDSQYTDEDVINAFKLGYKTAKQE